MKTFHGHETFGHRNHWKAHDTHVEGGGRVSSHRSHAPGLYTRATPPRPRSFPPPSMPSRERRGFPGMLCPGLDPSRLLPRPPVRDEVFLVCSAALMKGRDGGLEGG
jgi:hypothetical protein